MTLLEKTNRLEIKLEAWRAEKKRADALDLTYIEKMHDAQTSEDFDNLHGLLDQLKIRASAETLAKLHGDIEILRGVRVELQEVVIEKLKQKYDSGYLKGLEEAISILDKAGIKRYGRRYAERLLKTDFDTFIDEFMQKRGNGADEATS